ncbi:hypothetical protein AK812_SmicGene19542 [Symbiodinium microadriaticum]|uniref:Uncharacterized protein n=1 Tax=Symbiodinium microadriaticum TaxID=2951 RepID=A0A1Q9DS99_SYMMI|nr:hypothetical protein AK812_SmicGene19542 [Symbiodinium microadriaticum]
MALAQSVLFILINESCPLVGLGPAGFLDDADDAVFDPHARSSGLDRGVLGDASGREVAGRVEEFRHRLRVPAQGAGSLLLQKCCRSAVAPANIKMHSIEARLAKKQKDWDEASADSEDAAQ